VLSFLRSMKILRDLKKIKVNEERPYDISNQTYSLRKKTIIAFV
jgi:hypothetical protein